MEYSYKRRGTGYWQDWELLEFFEQSPKEEILHFINNDMKTIKSAGNAARIWEVIYEKCHDDLCGYNTPEAHEMYKWMAEVVDKVSGNSIIDVGSSFGIYWKYSKVKRENITLLDISQFAKNYFDEKISSELLSKSEFIVEDLAQLDDKFYESFDILFSMNTLDLVPASVRPRFQKSIQLCGPKYVICGGNVFPGIDIRESVGGRAFKHNFPMNLVHPTRMWDFGLGIGKPKYNHIQDFFFTPSGYARGLALSVYERIS